MTHPILARYRAGSSITRIDKIETAPDLNSLTHMVAHWQDMTDEERHAVARRNAELQRGKS